ncbi:hypothetical protein, partial [Burkholderia sp. SIMBA_019]|uniref:hypothetical protein n=1 Tax=Burkholderia sp. SIMBA_019 TaxID=3085765 RepID=UPI00397A265E
TARNQLRIFGRGRAASQARHGRCLHLVFEGVSGILRAVNVFMSLIFLSLAGARPPMLHPASAPLLEFVTTRPYN